MLVAARSPDLREWGTRLGPSCAALKPEIAVDLPLPPCRARLSLGSQGFLAIIVTKPRCWTEGCGSAVSARPDLSSGTQPLFSLSLTLACRGQSSLPLSSSSGLLRVMDFLKLIMRRGRFTT